MDNLLSIRNLWLEIRTKWGLYSILSDLNIELEKSRILGIIGESGCGKSMTALAIMRLLPTEAANIVSGEILFNGTDLLKLPGESMLGVRGKKIGMIFQEPMTALNPVFTVGDQVGEVLIRHEKPNRKRVKNDVLELLDSVGFPNPHRIFSSYPHHLSGGMRQRVVIAMAIACKPDLIIADEPTTALDVTVQEQIFGVLMELKNRVNAGMILISHDMGLIYKYTDDVCVMYAGRKVEEGKTKQVLKQPRHPYTKGLVNCIPKIYKNQADIPDTLVEIPGIVEPVKKGMLGCPFYERCHLAFDRCTEAFPQSDGTVGHQVYCHAANAESAKIFNRIRIV